jgi:hypothetical protein
VEDATVTEFVTKDSGAHQEYESGMRRDSQDGKPRFDLIRTKRQPYEEQMIYRYAMLLARGAEKYSARNWEEGDSEEELDRAKASLLRHTEQLVAGETDEDHAAAVWFNTQAIEYFRWRIEVKKERIRRKKRKAKGKWQGRRGAENLRRANRLEEKRLAALNASEIRNEALRQAAAMRRRSRMAEAAREFDDTLADAARELQETTLTVEASNVSLETVALATGTPVEELKAKSVEKDPIIDVNDDGSPVRQSDIDGTRPRTGAVGLFQFMNGPWTPPPFTIPRRIMAGFPLAHFTMSTDGGVTDNRTGQQIVPPVSAEEDEQIRESLQLGLDRDQRNH